MRTQNLMQVLHRTRPGLRAPALKFVTPKAVLRHLAGMCGPSPLHDPEGDNAASLMAHIGQAMSERSLPRACTLLGHIGQGASQLHLLIATS